jgi:L,D-transpeptidase ErfK/SrfK
VFLTLGLTVLFAAQLTGSEFQYSVRHGDSLKSVGARFGVSVRILSEDNQVKPASRLQNGQVLKIDNRHIVPSVEGARIVINVPQRLLFWMSSDGTVQGFPIAAGKRGWKTPRGDFKILVTESNPTWDVPLSIQEEMRREGKPVLTQVPPSPENPLGKYWIGLSIPGIGIHGTNHPGSIYGLVTHGCIRLHPDDIAMLFS